MSEFIRSERIACFTMEIALTDKGISMDTREPQSAPRGFPANGRLYLFCLGYL